MNRVLNKGFSPESCNNSTLIAFSGVFHPACCMQNRHTTVMEVSAGRPSRSYEMQAQKKSRASRKGESDEEQ